MTKLSDLGSPKICTRDDGPPVHETEYFLPCAVCNQAIDLRDLRQVVWHQRPEHDPLELDA
jgi:hypothetical protein